MAGMNDIVFYEPGEMVFSAQAGAPLDKIEAMLAGRGQMLAFEPMDHRRLYGSTGAPTVDALAACNISGPRRISHGAARDALIGLKLVNGRAEEVKTGGRVMKNVTGLDLVKLSAGAFGTLGVLTEATFKVLPRPETAATLVIRNLDESRAIEALSQALGSPFEVSGAAHLPAGVGGDEARTLLRVENFAPSVDYRIGELRKLVGGDVVLDADATQALWRDIRDCAFFAAPDPRAIWRVSTAPSRGPDFVRLMQTAGATAHRGRCGRRRARRRYTQCNCNLRRPCDAGARARRIARPYRRVPALVRRGDETHARHQGEFRSRRRSQSGPDVCGNMSLSLILSVWPGTRGEPETLMPRRR